MEILVETISSLTERTSFSRRVRYGTGILLLLIMLAWAGVMTGSARAEERLTSESTIKLAFLYNFAKFIQWPPGSASKEFVIGIVGNNDFPVGEDKKEVGGKKVVLRRILRVDQARDCQIVFVPAAEKSLLPHLLRTLEGRPVVTVGDYEGFLRGGGMINLISAKGRIAFDINVEATKKAGVTVGYQLLRLARELI